MRNGQIFVLKHLVQIILSAGIIVALAVMLYSCDWQTGEEETTIDSFMQEYDDVSEEPFEVNLGDGEAIIGYGSNNFQYWRDGIETSEQLLEARHLRGLYSERPNNAICAEDMTCICHCGRLKVTTMTTNETSDYLADTAGSFRGGGQPAGTNVEQGKLQCLDPTCRSHQASIQTVQDASSVFGESYDEYESHQFFESFAVINAPSVTKPGARANGKPLTIAGYTDEGATRTQTVVINNGSEGQRSICIGSHCDDESAS